MSFSIDEDIRRAATPPPALYRDPALFAQQRERVFARAWHWAGDLNGLDAPGQQRAVTLQAGCLDEPLVFTCDADRRLHCLSNVCTHRANLVVEGEASGPTLRCRYHGRRFALDGTFLSMPEFEGAVGFPSECDNLPRVAHGRLGPLGFAALDPLMPLDALLAPVRARLGRLGPLDTLTLDPASCRDYRVAAHWALYCENYLEGLHIPFVHPQLASGLDYAAYRTELSPWGSLQIGVASDGEPAFDERDEGQRIAAYYFWLFPATMLNFYPWGLSLNVVTPLGIDRTRIQFRSYRYSGRYSGRYAGLYSGLLAGARAAGGAGGDLDQVEREDEAVVERVQRGVSSRLYRGGRYSPTRETGVHHFHRLLLPLL